MTKKEKKNCYSYKKTCTKVTHTHAHIPIKKSKALEPICQDPVICESCHTFSYWFCQPHTVTGPSHAWTKTKDVGWVFHPSWHKNYVSKLILTIIQVMIHLHVSETKENRIFKVPVCYLRKNTIQSSGGTYLIAPLEGSRAPESHRPWAAELCVDPRVLC